MEHLHGCAVRGQSGWASALSRSAAAILLFELISGLAITFGPFHPITQWGLLLHTVIGILTIAPLVWYFARHWKNYAGQAILAVKTAPVLRYTHLVSTLLAFAATLPHILIGWWRRRKSNATRPAVRWALSALAAVSAGVAIVIACSLAYSGSKYTNRFPADYSFPYGANRPFAPSLAHTSTNGAFDPRSLAGSESCGQSGCHTEIYNEWKTSAHRYAAMDPIFQGIQGVMAKQNGPESTRYCGGCHDPISLFSGSKNVYATNLTGQLGYNEGISCLACHSI